MKVFISWSGNRSKQVAELLDSWIQCVIQSVDPWMSSKDIDRGTLWFTEIANQLADTSVGVICMTKENKNKPWILFESGALAKGLSSNRVCTFLIDLIPTDLENPLAQFNHTMPNREDLLQLVKTINSTLKDKALKESILLKAFTTYWPQFEDEFESIIKNTSDTKTVEKRENNDIMLEVLTTVRTLDKRLRSIENHRDHSRITTSGITESDSLVDQYRRIRKTMEQKTSNNSFEDWLMHFKEGLTKYKNKEDENDGSPPPTENAL